MRNYLIKFFLLMFVSFCVTADDVVKVYDKGLDGNMRMYSIGCPNGKKTAITQKFGELKDIKPSQVTENTFEPEEPKEEIGDYDYSSGSDDGPPIGDTISSVKDTALDLKQRFLNLAGKENIEVCLYPIGVRMECKAYKDIDTAAKAACDLMR